MAKILIAAVFLGGLAAIEKAITDDPIGAAEDILELKAELDSAVVINGEFEKELERHAARPVVTNPVEFEQEDHVYGFNFKSMIHNSKRISQEDVLASKELQHELIAMGSGMIYLKS